MDAQTLLIINLSVATTLNLVMLGLYFTNRQETSLIHWSLAAAGFWGNALLGLVYTPDITPYWLGPPLGNTLLVSSYLFLLTGLCHYLKKPASLWMTISILCLVYALHFSHFAQAGFINRTLLCFPVLIIISLYTLYRLFNANLQGMRIAVWLFAIFIGVNLLQLSIRLLVFIYSQMSGNLLDNNLLIHNAGTLAILLFMLGTLTSCMLLLVRQKTLQLQQLANTDPLTGWLNRQSMQQRLDSEWHRCKRLQQPLSLMLFDIDHFKQVNDNYGHSTGDQVLQHTCIIAGTLLRDYDLLFRIGGEEFLVCLPNVDENQLKHISERLRQRMDGMQLSQQPELKLTISIGCASANDTTTSWQVLLEQADKALYQAKLRGRNQVQYFNEACAVL